MIRLSSVVALLLASSSCGNVDVRDQPTVQFATFCPAAPDQGVACPSADSFDFAKGADGQPDVITCRWECALYRGELRDWRLTWTRNEVSAVGELCYGQPEVVEVACE